MVNSQSKIFQGSYITLFSFKCAFSRKIKVLVLHLDTVHQWGVATGFLSLSSASLEQGSRLLAALGVLPPITGLLTQAAVIITCYLKTHFISCW